MVRKLLKVDLARALGISPSLVSRHAKLGMPVHNVEAARAWRDTHLAPALRKEYRQPAHAPATPPASDEATVAAQLVELVHGLSELAAIDFARWAEQLRRALRAIPVEYREGINLPQEIWHQLVEKNLEILRKYHPDERDSDAGSADVEEEDPDDLAGRFIYALACGEVRVLEPEEPASVTPWS